MNKQTLKAIAYAQNALSFLFLDASLPDAVKAIYLYGSAARGELEEDSDIDLFIDCDEEKGKAVEGIASSAVSKFYQSKDFEKWKLFKFDYPFSFNAGDLKYWHLKTSIMADGILLYSKKASLLPAERKVLFTFTLPKKKAHYLHFIREMFGRKEKGYKDNGLLGSVNGRKISSSAIIIPKENMQKIAEFMQKHKVDYRFLEICVLSVF